MSIELGRRLLASELVTRENVRDALLFAEARGVSLPRALIERGIITEAELDDEIARLAGAGLRYVQGSIDLVMKLPRSMARRLSALPTRTDPNTGVVDVAAADPFDPHVEAEMSFHLKTSVRVLRASISAVEEAIRRIDVILEDAPAVPEEKSRQRRHTPALPYGAPGSIPPPAPSTPIPLIVKRSPNSVSFDDADTYVDDLNPNEPEDFGRTAGWGTAISVRAPTPNPPRADEAASLGRTAGWGLPAPIRPSQQAEEFDDSASLGRTAAWGATTPSPINVDQDEPDDPPTLGRTAAWGASAPARPAVTMAVDDDDEETVDLGRTAAWGSTVGTRVATVAPAQPLGRTLGFEEEPPRVSFPSVPPAGSGSVPPPIGFAPPEVSAWKGLTNPPVSPDIVDSVSTSAVNIPGMDEQDVETTFVSADDELPLPSNPGSSVETISLNSIPDVAGAEAGFDDDFDDVPQRPTLVDFPPPAAVVDVKMFLTAMNKANHRDDIVELAFRCMGLFANRVALFSAKRDGFHGWLCNEAFGSPEALRKVVIPNNQPSVMATAATTTTYLGPLPTTPVHGPLLAVMGKASSDLAVASVRVGGKVAAMLVCDELRDTLSSTRKLDELARTMGDALTRLVKTRG